MQEILDSAAARLWLGDAITRSSRAVDICSAYIRSEALLSLFGGALSTSKKTRVLARWSPQDLASGASDLEVFKECQAHGVPFHVHSTFHGKIYQIDPLGVLIGSFNLTRKGFSINRIGNDEAGVLIPCTPATNSFVDDLFSRSIALDEDLFKQIADFISFAGKGKDLACEWPAEIQVKLQPNPESVSKLLVTECFFCTYDEFCDARSTARSHDLSLLGMREVESTDPKRLAEQVRQTRLFTWLTEQLRQSAGEIYFGQLTALLHDALFDDPKPYRKDVKNLLVNFLSWLKALGIQEIYIDRPQHSERIQLAKKR